MNETEEIIQIYLTDETKRYQDWFQALNPSDDDTVPFAQLPALPILKKRFKKWFEAQRPFLHQKICQDWGYANQKKKFQQKQSFIIALSIDCLAIALSLPTTNTIAIATILVAEDYLEELCSETTVQS
jgi:phage anti-repressor protein